VRDIRFARRRILSVVRACRIPLPAMTSSSDATSSTTALTMWSISMTSA